MSLKYVHMICPVQYFVHPVKEKRGFRLALCTDTKKNTLYKIRYRDSLHNN